MPEHQSGGAHKPFLAKEYTSSRPKLDQLLKGRGPVKMAPVINEPRSLHIKYEREDLVSRARVDCRKAESPHVALERRSRAVQFLFSALYVYSLF